MPLSRVLAIGDGTTTQFPVNFALDYLLEADVTCRVGTEADGLGDPVYRDITFLSTNLLEVSGPPAGIGVQVAFTRTVDKDNLRVDYTNGDALDEDNLMIAQKQAMMAVHEVLDGRFGAMGQDLNLAGWRIVNMAEPINPGDGSTKAYTDSRIDDGAANAAAAAASADAAAAAETGATSKLTEVTSAGNAAISAVGALQTTFTASSVAALAAMTVKQDAAAASATAAAASAAAAAASVPAASPPNTLLGNKTAGAAFPVGLTMTEVLALLRGTDGGKALRIAATPAQGRVCLLSDYGLVGDYLIGTGSGINPTYTDNYAAWQTVMALATRGDEFILPNGTQFNSYTAFNTDIRLPDNCKLRGVGRSTSAIIRARNPGVVTASTFLDIGAYTEVSDMLIMCGDGTFSGSAIGKVATSGPNSAQDNVIRNVFVGGLGALGSCNWFAALYIDSTNGAPAYGSRSILVDGFQGSRYTNLGFSVSAQNAGNFMNIDLAANSGYTPTADLHIWGTAGNTNNSLNFAGSSFDTVSIDRTSSCTITTGATASITMTSTCASIHLTCGFFSGTPVLNGANLRVHAGKFTYDSAS